MCGPQYVIQCTTLVNIVTYFWLSKPFGLDIADIDSPAASTAFVANSRHVAATLLLAARSNVASLVRRSNKKKSFT